MRPLPIGRSHYRSGGHLTIPATSRDSSEPIFPVLATIYQCSPFFNRLCDLTESYFENERNTAGGWMMARSLENGNFLVRTKKFVERTQRSNSKKKLFPLNSQQRKNKKQQCSSRWPFKMMTAWAILAAPIRETQQLKGCFDEEWWNGRHKRTSTTTCKSTVGTSDMYQCRSTKHLPIEAKPLAKAASVTKYRNIWMWLYYKNEWTRFSKDWRTHCDAALVSEINASPSVKGDAFKIPTGGTRLHRKCKPWM